MARRCLRCFRLGILVLAALLLMGLPTASACHSSTGFPVGNIPNLNFGDDFGQRFYLKSKAGTASMSLDPAAPSDSEHVISETGPALGVGSVQGGAGRSVTFALTTPLEHTLWLNLSKPAITGVLWWSSSTAQSPNRDVPYFRVSVLVGSKFAGGDHCGLYSLTTTHTGGWVGAPINIRPEVDKLPQGETVSIRVTWYGGLSDLRLGTSGARQSFFEFRVTPFDLASKAVYLENHQLRYTEPEAPPTAGLERADAPPGGIPAVLALAPVALLSLSARRGGRAALAAALFLGAGLAGCVGAPAEGQVEDVDSETPPKPTASATLVEDRRLQESNIAQVRGYVRDEGRIPLPGAYVAILGTSVFGETNSKGYFDFPNVSAGSFKIRVDKSPYTSLEQRIDVELGKILWFNVTLVLPSTVGANQQAHKHDDWLGAVTMPLWQQTFRLTSPSLAADAVAVAPLPAGPEEEYVVYCLYDAPCSSYIPAGPPQRNIPAGTGMLEVTLRWDPAVVGYSELGLQAVGAKSHIVRNDGKSYHKQVYLAPRPPGQPFKIFMFPDEADPGHQQFTRWSFYATTLATSRYSPWISPAQVTTRPIVSANFVAHKGVVVPEPAHPDFWGNATSKNILNEVQKTVSCAVSNYPSTCAYWYYIDFRSKIPPGTKDVTGVLRWEPNLPAPATTWSLAYKGGDTPANVAPPAAFKKVEVTKRETNRIEFRIVPQGVDLDPFYVPVDQSGWVFWVDDQADAIPGTTYSANNGYQSRFILSLTLNKDPDWRD